MTARTTVRTKTTTTIKTEVKVLADDNVTDVWSLVVNIDWQGLKFHLAVEEPYLSSYEEWTSLIQGKKRTIFGGGNSSIRSDHEILEVNAEVSGGGKDLVIGISLPRDAVAADLQEAIDFARSCGMKFATPPSPVDYGTFVTGMIVDPHIEEAHRQWVEEMKADPDITDIVVDHRGTVVDHRVRDDNGQWVVKEAGSVMKEGAAPSE